MPERRKRPAPKNEIPSRQSDKMAPNELDFWDIDDSSDPPDTPSGQAKAPAKKEPRDAPSGQAKAPAKKEPRDEQTGAESPADGQEPDPSPRSQDSPAGLTSEGNTAAPSKPNTRRPKTTAASRTEKSSLIVLGVLLAAAAIGCVSLFFSKIPTAPKTSKIEFPVTGEFVVIRDIRTFWRRPNREKDRGVQQKARLIPTATVTLGESSGGGALRFFFENDSGRLIGDSSTRAVGDGSFAVTNTPEDEIHATGGFNDTGSHAAYVTGQIDPWHLIVKEGPDRNAPGRDFKELLRIPISVTRQ